MVHPKADNLIVRLIFFFFSYAENMMCEKFVVLFWWESKGKETIFDLSMAALVMSVVVYIFNIVLTKLYFVADL